MRHAAARLAGAAVVLALGLLVAGCGGHSSPTTPHPVRTYLMGFSGVPPRADLPLLLQAIDLWSPRADAALVLNEPPWGELLRGVPADSLVRRDQLGLVNHYRARGHRIVVSIDPTNGLNRASDAESLKASGRSIAEAPVRALYRDYCVAVDTLLRPDWLGLASETNLVRLAAPAAIYAGVVAAAGEVAAAVRVHDAQVRLFSTVQVEVAWGRLPAGGTYTGIAQDRTDFAFMQGLGLSSYPYFSWSEPDSVPLDYYTRLVQGSPLPVLVIEGGWSSASFPGVTSTPEMQARYIRRQAALLDAARAAAWFQITFTDLDLTSLPPATAGALRPFAFNGLVTATLAAKPALPEWDAVQRRARVAP
jgi:hypothetical protein